MPSSAQLCVWNPIRRVGEFCSPSAVSSPVSRKMKTEIRCCRTAKMSCAAGLCLFGGPVVRFDAKHGLKVPQIGWNQLEIKRPDCPLFEGIAEGSYVYFVHSFFPRPEDSSIIATRTVYGETFASAVWRQNVYATQFHPEKSQAVGLKLLRNFVELI